MQRTVEELGRHHSEWDSEAFREGYYTQPSTVFLYPHTRALVLYPIISLVTFVS